MNRLYAFQKFNYVNKNLSFKNVSIKPRTITINKNNISLERKLQIRENMEWSGEPFLIKDYKAKEFVDMSCDNSYDDSYNSIISLSKEKSLNRIIIGGPVFTPERALQLINAGADIIRIGPVNTKFSFSKEEESGCFHGSSQVLMADGSLKNIDKLKKNDCIINKDGNSVNVNSLTPRGYKDVLTLFNNHFETQTIVTPDHRYYIYDFVERNFKWLELKDIIGNFHYKLVIPKKINWALEQDYDIRLDNEKVVKSKFVLGYYTGMYLLFNHDNNKLLIPKNSYFYDKSLLVLEYILKYLFCTEFDKKIIEHYCEITLEDPNIMSFINNNIYLCNNEEYIKGIYDVLKNVCKEELEFKNIFDVYKFCCINLNKDINGEKLQEIGNYLILDNIDVSTTERKENVWDITCDTNSFICDFCTVHNSSKDEIDEDFDLPDLTSVIDCADMAHSKDKRTLMTVDSNTAFKALVAGIDFIEFQDKNELDIFKNKIIDKMYRVNSLNLDELYNKTEFIIKN
jgi:autonomous glycyl radical cofactor GrcA